MHTWTHRAGPRSPAAPSEGAASCPPAGGGVRECRWAERRRRRSTRPPRLVATPRVALRSARAAVVIKSPKLVAVSKGAARCVVARTICRVKERLGRFGYLLRVAGGCLGERTEQVTHGRHKAAHPTGDKVARARTDAVLARGVLAKLYASAALSAEIDLRRRLLILQNSAMLQVFNLPAERAVAMFKMASGQWGAHGGPHRLHTTDRPPRSMPALANGGARSCPLTATRSFMSPPNGSHGGVRVSCMARDAISAQQPLRMGSRRGFC